MARSYTAVQKGAIQNYQVMAYYNSVFLGIFTSGDHTFTHNENIEYSKASFTGSSNFKAHITGTETSVTLTVAEYNKNTIKTVLTSIQAVSGGTATNAGSPFTGAIEGVINPQSITERPLVLYPIFTDEAGIYGIAGTQYIDNTSNPLTILLPKAVCVGGFELAFNSETPTEFELTFQGMPDEANGLRPFLQSAGIDTDGTYTP